MRANKNKFDNYYARWGVHVDSRLTTWVAATHAHNEHHHTPRHTRHRTWLACAVRAARLLARPRPRGGSASGYPPFPVARGAARPKSASNRDRRSAGGLGGRRGHVINRSQAGLEA